MAARIFAVLAAILLVIAVGIAALTPFGMMLGQGLLPIGRASLEWTNAHLPKWLWDGAVLPFLVRPVWLLPACLGLICAGVALTFNLGKASPSRRRRS